MVPARSDLCNAQERTGINASLTKGEVERRYFLSWQVGCL